jgi:hypothetical protein
MIRKLIGIALIFVGTSFAQQPHPIPVKPQNKAIFTSEPFDTDGRIATVIDVVVNQGSNPNTKVCSGQRFARKQQKHSGQF